MAPRIPTPGTTMNDTRSPTRLLTDKRALNHTRIDTQRPARPAAEGEAMLSVWRAAITTNNITYAAFGDAMQYWNFFPTGRGRLGPHAGLGLRRRGRVHRVRRRDGRALLRLFPDRQPPAHAPVRVTERGFYDGAEHRRLADLGLQPVHALQPRSRLTGRRARTTR